MKPLLSFATLLALALAGCGKNEPVAAAAEAPAPAHEAGIIALPPNSPQLARIHSEAVGSYEFPVEAVSAPGRVEANANRISKVVMPVAGRVRSVEVKLGDAVAEGQPLLVIDSPDASAAMMTYRQAQAGLRQANLTKAKAEKDLARLHDLHNHRAAAEKDVLSAENDAAQAAAAVEQAQAACDDALHRLDVLGLKPGQPADVIVRAPLPGKILDLSVVPGEYRNDTSTPLMTIADLRTVWIGADVPESLIRRVSTGEYIEVQLSAYPEKKLRGRVTRIADVVDPDTRTVKVQAEIPNPGGLLRPDMFGQISHSHGLAAQPAVPAGAVIQRDGVSLLLIEQSPGRFRETPVTLGERRDGMVAISSGIAIGARVVVDGAMLLGKE